MKRSEMIQKLNEQIIIIEAQPFPEGISSAGQWLLHIVELNGMSPPDRYNTVFGFIAGYISPPQWESEND